MNKNWTEWVTKLGGFGDNKMAEIGFMPFLVAVGISLLCALFICLLYNKFYKARATGSQVQRAFPLLAISITAVFIAIQFSLPLSLGLLGALSIVRFRTPIKEPEEIGFIMLVIATSLCCATFNILFLGVLLTVAVLALLIQWALSRWLTDVSGDGTVLITIPARVYRARSAEIVQFITEHAPAGRIESVTETGDEVAVSYSFLRGSSDILPVLLALEKAAEGAKVNVFFHRAGEV